jgi:hypothetical protein
METLFRQVRLAQRKLFLQQFLIALAWCWFAALLLHFYCDLVDAACPDFGKRYLHVADAAQKLQAQLETNFERLAKEERAMYTSAKGK